jgi:hypothetical protein
MAKVKPANSFHQIRVFNPTQLSKRKAWTDKQAAAAKDLAEIYAREVLEDDDRADDIAAMTPAEYAAEQLQKVNPTRRMNSMKRKVRTNQQTVTGAAIAQPSADQDKLRRENARLKKKIESMQDTLDEIADVASASPDGSEDNDPDELCTKLNTILDLAAPGAADDDEDEDED